MKLLFLTTVPHKKQNQMTSYFENYSEKVGIDYNQIQVFIALYAVMMSVVIVMSDRAGIMVLSV